MDISTSLLEETERNRAVAGSLTERCSAYGCKNQIIITGECMEDYQKVREAYLQYIRRKKSNSALFLMQHRGFFAGPAGEIYCDKACFCSPEQGD